jgi:hypothetical protein
MMLRTPIVLLIMLATVLAFSFKLRKPGVAKLSAIAKEYKSYTMHKTGKIVVTDSAKYKWTIALCGRPTNGRNTGFHYGMDSNFMSKANKWLSPHGNKLYRLYVKNYDAYERNAPSGQPIGQVIVKETWHVQEIAKDSAHANEPKVQSQIDGKWYTPSIVSELFIMYKERSRSDNDQGWSYGTYSIENPLLEPMLLNNVKLGSCISCHQDTKYDRIFGVK